MKLTYLLALLFLLFAPFAHAIDPLIFKDAAQEKRFHYLAEELRCLVCQNESLSDSSAPLAQDLRRQVKEQMDAGKSNAEIKLWLVDRYGDFVLYRPAFKGSTAVLWIAPFAVLALGIWLSLRTLRARRALNFNDPEAPLLEARLRQEKEIEL